MFWLSRKLYFFDNYWWKAEPKRGISKSIGTSLYSKRVAIFFLKTTSSSSIFGLIYLSSSVGQNPQKALHIIFPDWDFSSLPKISFLNFSKISCLWSSCCFSFSRFFWFYLSKFFFWFYTAFCFALYSFSSATA